MCLGTYLCGSDAALSYVQVRTQTLVKNAIIQIDATPFRQWYQQHYGIEVGLKKKLGAQNVAGDEKQVSNKLAYSRLAWRFSMNLCTVMHTATVVCCFFLPHVLRVNDKKSMVAKMLCWA